MEDTQSLPLNWQEGDVCGWRVSLTPLDSLGFPMRKFGARVSAPEGENLTAFATSLGDLVKQTVIREMLRVYANRSEEVELKLD